jgi:glutamine amidotransferase/cyclase
MISLLDYGAGNVRSLRNAITHLGFDLIDIQRPDDILAAERLLFPGVGAFGAAMERLHRLGYVEPLREYLAAGRPYLGHLYRLADAFRGQRRVAWRGRGSG